MEDVVWMRPAKPEREALACGWIRMLRVRCGRLVPEECVMADERLRVL